VRHVNVFFDFVHPQLYYYRRFWAATKAMSDSGITVKEARDLIDLADRGLVELLIQRYRAVASLGPRDDKPQYQPRREAQILRQLVAECGTGFPAETLVLMWRELLGATIRLQGDFTVAVYVVPEVQGYWDLARDHYGSLMTMLQFGSTLGVFHAVANAVPASKTDRKIVVGVLPMPQTSPEPWWPLLVQSAPQTPQIIARLPFAVRGNARSGGARALVIGHLGLERFDDDPVADAEYRTVIVTEDARVSGGTIGETLAAAGLSNTLLGRQDSATGSDASALTLIELNGLVTADDPRLADFRRRIGTDVQRIIHVGGYSAPLDLDSPTGAGTAARG
jgi:chorismate mutase / prephenate dehydratase